MLVVAPLVVAPLEVSCPGGVGLADLGSANELAVAIRLSRRTAEQTMTGFPGKSSMKSPSAETKPCKLICLKIRFVVPSEQVSHPNAVLAPEARAHLA